MNERQTVIRVSYSFITWTQRCNCNTLAHSHLHHSLIHSPCNTVQLLSSFAFHWKSSSFAVRNKEEEEEESSEVNGNTEEERRRSVLRPHFDGEFCSTS